MSAPYRPGQPPWPERRDPVGDTAPIRPAAQEPIQFQVEAPPPVVQNPALVWILRGLGLVAVAVISGLVWWYINDDSTPAHTGDDPTVSHPGGQFDFTPVEAVPKPLQDTNCAEHAYEKVQEFFRTTPCQQLTRALYTTTTPDGRKVYTNVSVVRMANDGDAAKLRELADKDGTGNVTDLIRDGVVKVAGLKSVAGAGYTAAQHGPNVIIVESAFDPGAKKGDKAADESQLDNICTDAIRLGDEIS